MLLVLQCLSQQFCSYMLVDTPTSKQVQLSLRQFFPSTFLQRGNHLLWKGKWYGLRQMCRGALDMFWSSLLSSAMFNQLSPVKLRIFHTSFQSSLGIKNLILCLLVDATRTFGMDPPSVVHVSLLVYGFVNVFTLQLNKHHFKNK